MPEWRQSRGVTPRPRSGAAAESTRLPQHRNGREELPHVRGQGQKLGGPHARGAVAKRSYPTSEVRGSSQECQAATAWEQPRGATPCLRSGAAVERSYPVSEVRGSGRECQAVTAQEQPRGATPHPRPGAAARRSNPMSKERWLCGRRRA